MSSRALPLQGKAAFVTGAGTGNGEAIAKRLHADGAFVALVGRTRTPMVELAAGMDPEWERTLVMEADVRDPVAMERAVAETISAFGRLDIAVNNAGIPGPAGTPLQDLEVADWKEVIDIDVNGVFHCMRAQIPAMLEK